MSRNEVGMKSCVNLKTKMRLGDGDLVEKMF